MKSYKMRNESDLLGEIQVPSEVYYGAQTQRALLNFPVRNQKTIGDYPTLIEGLVMCKKAAAIVNGKYGHINEEKKRAILKAADKIIEEQMNDQFPIHYLYGGGGTSGNMNTNEVIANIAEEILGGKRGEYKFIHPNGDVNFNQSTNDIYPTACHIAIINKWPQLKKILQTLINSLKQRSNKLKNQKRIARTCLQEAVDITFKDFLDGYTGFLKRSINRIEKSIENLYSVNLGGTIIGRKSDVPEEYFKEIIPALRQVTNNKKYVHSENLFDAAQNLDDMVEVSNSLAILAQGLIKIGKDFRLMSSGPEAGFGEISLPPVQPGSSIMPGKINPVIPEFLIQCCFMAVGMKSACELALTHGELDLNIWETLMVVNILDSIQLLNNGISAFEEKCVREFKINKEINEMNADSLIPLLTRLMHEHGYKKINDICKKAIGDNKKLRKLLKEKNLI